MVDRKCNFALRSISTIVLSFFIWTFGGAFEIAQAISNSQKSTVSSEKSQKSIQPTTSQPTKKEQKPEEKFQKTIEDIETLIEELRKAESAEDQKSKKENLRAKKSELATLDIEMQKQFKETEGKIKDLPEVIQQRHRDFVKSYDANMKELQANLDSIEKAKTKEETDAAIAKTNAHIEKTKPPKKKSTFDPNKLPDETPEIKEFKSVEKQSITKEEEKLSDQFIQVATIGSLAGLLTQTLPMAITKQTPPTEADLAETIEIKLTPEIRAKAAELQNSPVKICEFVRNSIDFEPYYGSLKGAQQTLTELAGNDFDQASLLIALLRAANVPARYVYGTIELPMDRLQNWIGGVKDANTAATILATNGIPGTLISEGGALKYAQFSHCWVETYVDMFPSMGAVNKQGKKYWTPIDPSMKETESSDSIDISKVMPFDETSYLNSADDRPPVLSYIYTLKDYYNSNFDYDFTKIFHVSVKKKKEFGIFMGTLPYKVISEQRYSEVPDIKRHKISLSLFSSGIYDTGESFTVQKILPEIAGKKVTISYAPATSSDQTVIDRYGGLLSTPAYLVNVKPEVKLDDAVILTGPVMGLGASLSATTSLTSPNMSTDTKTTDLSHGISYAIGLPALTYPGTQLVGQIDRLRVLEGTLHESINAMDTRAGELLQNIAIEYFGQLNNTSRSIEGIMHVQLTKMPSIAFVSADVTYDYVFGMPVSPPIMGGLGIDAIRVASSPMPIDGDLAQRKEFIKQRGLNSSYLEHKILENLLGIESISAVKALQIAAKNGIPIYTINKTNINSILPLLTLSNDDKADIQNAVNANKEVTVSRDNVTYYDWTGVGYIARDTNTGTGAYMISNELGGGGTVEPTNAEFKREQKIAWFMTGQEDSPGWQWNFRAGVMTDIVALPIWQWFGYIPCIGYDVSASDIIREMNNEQNKPWIFYYSGHGSECEDGEDYISPGVGATSGKAVDITVQVKPEDINTDAKIVFLDACCSVKNGTFKLPFSIDGYHKGVDGVDHLRKEVLIGWPTSVRTINEFALFFWMEMGIRKTVDGETHYTTVQEAINNVQWMWSSYFGGVYYPLNTNIKTLPAASDATLVP